MKIKISKYNSAFFDGNGKYLINEWTSISDIGKIYSGQEFTLDEYLEMEERYINIVNEFTKQTLSSFKFKLTKIEKYTISKINMADEALMSLHDWVEDGKTYFFEIENLPNILKLFLREDLWGEIILENKAKIFVGYDYYLYIETDFFEESFLKYINGNNLFYETVD